MPKATKQPSFETLAREVVSAVVHGDGVDGADIRKLIRVGRLEIRGLKRQAASHLQIIARQSAEIDALTPAKRTEADADYICRLENESTRLRGEVDLLRAAPPSDATYIQRITARLISSGDLPTDASPEHLLVALNIMRDQVTSLLATNATLLANPRKALVDIPKGFGINPHVDRNTMQRMCNDNYRLQHAVDSLRRRYVKERARRKRENAARHTSPKVLGSNEAIRVGFAHGWVRLATLTTALEAPAKRVWDCLQRYAFENGWALPPQTTHSASSGADGAQVAPSAADASEGAQNEPAQGYPRIWKWERGGSGALRFVTGSGRVVGWLHGDDVHRLMNETEAPAVVAWATDRITGGTRLFDKVHRVVGHLGLDTAQRLCSDLETLGTGAKPQVSGFEWNEAAKRFELLDNDDRYLCNITPSFARGMLNSRTSEPAASLAESPKFPAVTDAAWAAMQKHHPGMRSSRTARELYQRQRRELYQRQRGTILCTQADVERWIRDAIKRQRYVDAYTPRGIAQTFAQAAVSELLSGNKSFQSIKADLADIEARVLANVTGKADAHADILARLNTGRTGTTEPQYQYLNRLSRAYGAGVRTFVDPSDVAPPYAGTGVDMGGADYSGLTLHVASKVEWATKPTNEEGDKGSKVSMPHISDAAWRAILSNRSSERRRMMRRERWEMLARRDGIVMRTLEEWNVSLVHELYAKVFRDRAAKWEERYRAAHDRREAFRSMLRDTAAKIGANTQALINVLSVSFAGEKVGPTRLAKMQKVVRERIAEMADLREEVLKSTLRD